MPSTKQLLICVLQPFNKSTATGFKLGTDIDELIAWSEAQQTEDAQATPSKKEAEDGNPDDSSKPEDFSSLMNRIVSTSYHQYETLSVLRQLSFGLPAATIQKELVKDRLSKRNIVQKSDMMTIYEVHDSDSSFIYALLEKIDRLESGLNYLPSAMLLSTVAIFDGLMSDIVRAMFRVNSDRLKASEKKISLSQILDAKSLDDLISHAITDEIYAFSRNSHDEQVKFIEDNFNISIRKHWKRWPDFIEIFERRNLVAHGESNFTTRYVSICSKQGHKGSSPLLGKDIVVNYSYLRQSLNILIEFLILTNFSLWRKHVPDQAGEAFSRMNEVTFELIKNGQPRIAKSISEYCLSLDTKDLNNSTRLMLVVNLASSCRYLNNDDQAFKILDNEDWSASSDLFKICVAAIREDQKVIEDLMPLVKASNSLSADSVRDWPLFRFVRNKDYFKDTFKIVYGEDLTPSSSAPMTISVTSSENGTDSPPNDTEGEEVKNAGIDRKLH